MIWKSQSEIDFEVCLLILEQGRSRGTLNILKDISLTHSLIPLLHAQYSPLFILANSSMSAVAKQTIVTTLFASALSNSLCCWLASSGPMFTDPARFCGLLVVGHEQEFGVGHEHTFVNIEVLLHEGGFKLEASSECHLEFGLSNVSYVFFMYRASIGPFTRARGPECVCVYTIMTISMILKNN